MRDQRDGPMRERSRGRKMGPRKMLRSLTWVAGVLASLLNCFSGDRPDLDPMAPQGFLTYYLTSPCNMNLLTVIQPWAWPFVQNELLYQKSMGLSGTETVTTFGPGLGGTSKFLGAVLGPGNLIYLVPSQALTYTTIDWTTDTVGSLGVAPGGAAFAGGALAPDGRIFFAPANSTSYVYVDTGANTVNTFGPAAPGGNAYRAAVLAPNGNIYLVPFNANAYRYIDPNTNSVSIFGPTAPGGGAFAGGVLAPNGRIYLVPSTATAYAYIDTTTDSIVTFGSALGGTAFTGGVLGYDGMVYLMPTNATSIVRIDPSNNDVSTLAGLTGYQTGALAPNGRIYPTANNSTTFRYFDIAAGTSGTFGPAAPGGNAWQGSTLAPNGKMYLMPQFTTTYRYIDTKSVGSVCGPILRSAYFNKY